MTTPPISLPALVLLTLASAAAAQTPQRDRPSPPAVGTARVAGIVLGADAEARPIRRVRVSVNNQDRSVGRTTVTDDAGRFEFAALPAGRYTVSASREGWVAMAHGASRPGRPGIPIVVADGQRVSDVTIRMPRGSVITGTITDDRGQPVPGVSMRVLRYRYVGGERTLSPSGFGGAPTTDDRGQYRIYGLDAGDYLVVATLSGLVGFSARANIRVLTDADIERALDDARRRQPGPATAPGDSHRETGAVGFASVFYPGTTQPDQATMVTIGTGVERGGIDFSLQYVRTARIEGVVIAPEGVAPQTLTVRMIQSGRVSVPGIEFAAFSGTRPDTDGRFSFASVPPGTYTLFTQTGGRPAGPSAPPSNPRPTAPAFWAMTEVAVDGQPVSGLTLALQPGLTVSGSVQFEEGATPPPAKLNLVRMSLSSALPPGGGVSLGVPAAEVSATGEFMFTGVTPGRYRIMGSVPPLRSDGTGWQAKSSMVDGRDSLDHPIDIRRSLDGVVVTFSASPTELSGTLQDPSGRAAPDFHIIVFAADRAFWTPQTRRVRTTRPSDDGHFLLRGLPAGEYLLAALADVEPGEWLDPSFLERLLPSSMKVSLADGEKKTQDVQILAK